MLNQNWVVLGALLDLKKWSIAHAAFPIYIFLANLLQFSLIKFKPQKFLESEHETSKD